MIAFNMAESGFDDAFYRVKNSTITSYPWSSGFVSLSSGNIEGGYSAQVTDMGSNIKKIVVTGYSPTNSTTAQSQEARPITGYVQSSSQIGFPYGVFAKQSISMSGNATVDAYNSASGSYGGSNINNATNVLGTDSTGAGTVALSGNATIQGNALVGPGGTASSVITTSGNATVTGSKSTASSAQNFSSPSTSSTSEGALSISGNTNYSLSAGTHRFSSISISGNGKLTPLGAVIIYVDGAVSISGNGIATVSNTPTNTYIYVTGTSSVTLSGNGRLYAGIFAPASAVSNTGNGQLYGAVVAKTYSQSGNGNVHFDQALSSSGSSTGSNLTILSWQEKNASAEATSSSTTYV